MTVFFFNFDRLEALNDFHGHAARDFYLESLVKTLLKVLGEGAFLGRWADHEFVALIQPSHMALTNTPHRVAPTRLRPKFSQQWPKPKSPSAMTRSRGQCRSESPLP